MKERLDTILVNKGFSPSRDKAKRTIMEGLVFVDGNLADKAGMKYDVDSEFVVKGNPMPYVSRGGLKLAKAINCFGVDPNGCVCMDMGASTGGFTDCMLKNCAAKVYAVDVGYGQLDYRLRTDSRVVNIEKTNIRYMDLSLIAEKLDLISIDVSFISTRHMFPVCNKLLSDKGIVVSLIKPQFEAGREQVGKGGIVRDMGVHEDVIRKVIGYARDSNLYPHGLTFSPVKGTRGNIEYLIMLKREDNKGMLTAARRSGNVELMTVDKCVNAVVRDSHEDLDI